MRVEATANPHVLAWARRMAGLELDEAARKVGTRPNRLSEWEAGSRHPTIIQLRKLADIYKRPLAVFFLKTPPEDDPVPSDFRRFDPQAVQPLTPTLRVIIREAHIRRDAALDLFDEIDESPPQFKLTANLNENPEDLGRRLRNALSNTPPTSGDQRFVFNFWRTAAENAGVLVFQCRGVDVEEEMRGFSISERPLPVVVVNIKDAYAARSFSLFHELAHIMLNRGGLCILKESGPQTDVQKTEVFCNHVAGASLMPADALTNQPEVPLRLSSRISDEAVHELANRYGTSREAVLYRLVKLNRVTPEFYQRKRQAYAHERERRSQKARKGGFSPPHTMAIATSGRLFTSLVLQAYDDERITSSDVAEYLGVKLKHLDRIRAAISKGNGNGEPV